jgi:hypothetical protein
LFLGIEYFKTEEIEILFFEGKFSVILIGEKQEVTDFHFNGDETFDNVINYIRTLWQFWNLKIL